MFRFCVFVSVSVQVLDCALALAYVCGSVTGIDFHQSFYILVYHLMLGHRVDACASHVELSAPWVTEASLLRGIFLYVRQR